MGQLSEKAAQADEWFGGLSLLRIRVKLRWRHQAADDSSQRSAGRILTASGVQGSSWLAALCINSGASGLRWSQGCRGCAGMQALRCHSCM